MQIEYMIAGALFVIIAILIIVGIIFLMLLTLHGKRRGWVGNMTWRMRRAFAHWLFLALGLTISLGAVILMVIRFQQYTVEGWDWQTTALAGVLLAILVIIIYLLAQMRFRGKVYWTEQGVRWR